MGRRVIPLASQNRKQIFPQTIPCRSYSHGPAVEFGVTTPDMRLAQPRPLRLNIAWFDDGSSTLQSRVCSAQPAHVIRGRCPPTTTHCARALICLCQHQTLQGSEGVRLKIRWSEAKKRGNRIVLPNLAVGRAERDGARCWSRCRRQQHLKAEGLQSAHIMALQAWGVEMVEIVGSQILIGRLIAQHMVDADQ
jgi:hypothetical protein